MAHVLISPCMKYMYMKFMLIFINSTLNNKNKYEPLMHSSNSVEKRQ